MNFGGNAYVELRPPKNLDDLKAYTSLSLKLQRPERRGDGKRRRRQTIDKGDMFVLYIGNRDVSESKSMTIFRPRFLIMNKPLTNVRSTVF